MAQAVEDAMAITAVLSMIKSRDQLPAALKAYEISRKGRVTEIQIATAKARESAIRKDAEAKEAPGINKEGDAPMKSEDVVKVIRSTWDWDAAEAARTAFSEIMNLSGAIAELA